MIKVPYKLQVKFKLPPFIKWPYKNTKTEKSIMCRTNNVYCCCDTNTGKTTNRLIRTPRYIIGFVLLFAITILILIALSTNNWQVTLGSLRTTTYYTQGLWYSCRNVQVSWYGNRLESFCQSIISISDPWLVACQVLYTMAAFITVFAFIVSVIGFFADLGVHLVAVPSFVQWNLIISTVLQLISVSVYGGKGIGNYSLIEPDYSLIIAGIATGLSAVCTLFFVLETECGGKNAENQEFISK